MCQRRSRQKQQRRARRVVGFERARGTRAGRGGAGFDRANHGLDALTAQHARAQDARRVAAEIDDGAFDADRAVAAVEHFRHGVAELGAHVRGRGRADVAEAVGRRRRQATAEFAQQGQGHRVVGAAQADGVLAAGHHVGYPGLLAQHQGQRAGPEGRRQLPGCRRHLAGPVVQRLDAGHVHDQRVVGRPALEGENAAHGFGVAGIRGQAIHGFGGQADGLAPAQGGQRGLQGRVHAVLR